MDVAPLSDVSHMTVSRVFSGRDAVADATRERVLKAARQLGYRPNQVARSLVQARTRTLGVVTLPNLWFRDMLIGAEEMARERGFGLVQTSASVDPKVEQERVEVLRERQVDGLLLLSPSDVRDHDLLRALHRAGVPLVTVNRYVEDLGFWRLFFDFRGATRAVTRRLVAAGHREVMYVGSSPDHAQETVRERVAGYREALMEAGHWRPEAEVFGNPNPFDADEMVADGIRRCPGATAMLTVNDAFGACALRVLRRAGRRVPDDMAVVSLHDTEIARCTDPPLTAVRHPTFDAGREGCRLLIEQIEQPCRPAGTRVLPASLVVRESCTFDASVDREEVFTLEQGLS
jgi:LacI family transcriptional regulator